MPNGAFLGEGGIELQNYGIQFLPRRTPDRDEELSAGIVLQWLGLRSRGKSRLRARSGLPDGTGLLLGQGRHRVQGLRLLRERTPDRHAVVPGRIAFQWNVLRFTRERQM